ncbi:MAG TPA: N-acetyltransferase [Ruminococcaceae bacterium]|nr:N-acetyltransferase [Oscillospiraceae bacterium]
MKAELIYNRCFMIIQVTSIKQLDICLDIIHKSFQTVADEFNLTTENCPSHTAFMLIKKLITKFENNAPMFLYKYNDCYAGYFSLSVSEKDVELNNLAVLPEYRHLGIGRELVNYVLAYSKNIGANKIKIGIIEDNTVLKKWYEQFDFVHTGTKRFSHLPFTVGFMELRI